jgi:tetratricopeptide (TPR) repeat protein
LGRNHRLEQKYSETGMAKWAKFPQLGEFSYTATSVRKHWSRLHASDCEPCPTTTAELSAWALFHNGDFEAATETGLKAGGSGITAANKATCIYANYLEPKESKRIDLFMAAALRAEAQQADNPDNINAWYLQAYALGRYSQGISVARALAEGLGTKVRKALETTIRLAPSHADAHYGAKKETGLRHYQTALRLNPQSAIAMMEYANGMVMLEGDWRMNEANALYEQAIQIQPADAMERLDVEMAKAEMAG